jgi:hypothetical protein
VDVVEVSGGLEDELRGRFREMFREVRGALGG